MNLSHLFDLSFTGRRNKLALEFRGATYTFKDIDERSNRLAHLLLQRGLQKGDAVPVLLNEAHSFRNNSSHDLEFMIIGIATRKGVLETLPVLPEGRRGGQ